MAGVMGHSRKADANKQGWEQSDFPLLCETCLGDNPYVRMTKEASGGACKICERPFTVFRWKPGPQARFKKTEVCQMCAKVKNVCQTCVLDLQYGLPVEVRDTYLQQAAAKAGEAAGSTALALATRPMPTSDVNRMYAIQQAERAFEEGGAEVNPYGDAGTLAAALPAAHEALMRLARTRPYYARNLAHLCSFFAKGECNRGAECPYRHEMPREKDDPLARQNIGDRYAGTADPVAARILGRLGMGPLAEGGGGGGGRVPEAPSDPEAKTLWVTGITDAVREEELRSAFAPHGEVSSVRLVTAKQCAFVEMGGRSGAEAGVAALANSLTINGVFMRVGWARPKVERGEGGQGSAPAPHPQAYPGYPPPYFPGYAYPPNPAQAHVEAAGGEGAGEGGAVPPPPPAYPYPPPGYYMPPPGYYMPPPGYYMPPPGAYPPHFTMPPVVGMGGGTPHQRGQHAAAGGGPERRGGGGAARQREAAPFAAYPSMDPQARGAR